MQGDQPEAASYEDEFSREFNDTSRELASSTTEAINVQLYTVVTWFVALLTLLSVGLLGNAALLLATTTSRRYRNGRSSSGGHVTRHSTSLLVNQTVVGFLMCLVIAPLEFATVAENYVKRPLPEVVCWAGATGYQFTVAVLITCIVLQAVAQCRHLRHCSATAKTRVQPPERPGCRSMIKRCRWLTLFEALLPWLVGLSAAGLTSFELTDVFDYRVCLDSVVYRQTGASGSSDDVSGTGDGPSDAWRWRSIMAGVYLVALVSAGAVLGKSYFAARRQLDNLLGRGGGGGGGGGGLGGDCECGKRLLEDAGCGASEIDLVELNNTTATTSHGGKNTRTGSERSQRRGDSSKKKKQSSVQPTEEEDATRATQQTSESAEVVDEDEDTFDLKMRLKFQKKSRSSGRRHTVANIGLPDLVGRLRRGSLSDTGLTAGDSGLSVNRRRPVSGGRGDGGSATTPEYHYVRKWSVDIVALADQLENPKAALMMTSGGRTGSCQLNELSGSLRTTPSPPGDGSLMSGRMRPGRSSSPVAARPTLPRIAAENESMDQDLATTANDCVNSGKTTDEDAQKNGPVELLTGDDEVKSTTHRSVVDGGKETKEVTPCVKGVVDVPTPKTRNEASGSVSKCNDIKMNTDCEVRRCSLSSESAADQVNRYINPLIAGGGGSVDLQEKISSLVLDPPSIVVSSLNEDEANQRSINVNSDDDNESTSVHGDSVWNVLQGHRNQCSSTSQSVEAESSNARLATVDDRLVARIRRQLRRTKRIAAVVAASTALAAPYTFLMILNSSLVSIGDQTNRITGYNLTLSAAGVLGFLFAAHGPLMVWVDRRSMVARLFALWTELSHLRCVCYCNIGRGKNCFLRQPSLMPVQDGIATTGSSS